MQTLSFSPDLSHPAPPHAKAAVDRAKLSGMNTLQKMRMLEEKGSEFAERQLRGMDVMGIDGDLLHGSQVHGPKSV